MNPTHQAALNTLRSAGFFIVVWTPEEVANVDDNDLSCLEDSLIQRGNDFIEEHQKADSEPGICAACNGSGEGQYDGTRCSLCRGSGVERSQSDDFEEPERDSIYA